MAVVVGSELLLELAGEDRVYLACLLVGLALLHQKAAFVDFVVGGQNLVSSLALSIVFSNNGRSHVEIGVKTGSFNLGLLLVGWFFDLELIVLKHTTLFGRHTLLLVARCFPEHLYLWLAHVLLRRLLDHEARLVRAHKLLIVLKRWTSHVEILV